MNFLVTTYIYPLAVSFPLSAHLKIELDNPRTEDEISLVERFLIRAFESGEDYGLPITSDEDIVTVEDALFRFRDFMSSDPHLIERFAGYERENALRFAASIWVIARYDDEGESQRLYEYHRRMREQGHLTFSIVDEVDLIFDRQEALANYGYLLSLLVNSEGDSYHGRGFIIAHPEPTRVQDKSMWFQFLMLAMICSHGKYDLEAFRKESLRWVFFPNVRSELELKSKVLDEAFKAGLSDKFLYIGSLLRISAEEARNERIRLLVLTTVLELLVTHSPDYSRFNVEESIGKQFRLKVALLTYQNDKTRDLIAIGKQLKVIYEQRSHIAHGNFDAVNKYVKGLSKEEGKEEYFDDLVSVLYVYIRAIIEEYVKDRSLVDFLKAN